MADRNTPQMETAATVKQPIGSQLLPPNRSKLSWIQSLLIFLGFNAAALISVFVIFWFFALFVVGITIEPNQGGGSLLPIPLADALIILCSSAAYTACMIIALHKVRQVPNYIFISALCLFAFWGCAYGYTVSSGGDVVIFALFSIAANTVIYLLLSTVSTSQFRLYASLAVAAVITVGTLVGAYTYGSYTHNQYNAQQAKLLTEEKQQLDKEFNATQTPAAKAATLRTTELTILTQNSFYTPSQNSKDFTAFYADWATVKGPTVQIWLAYNPTNTLIEESDQIGDMANPDSCNILGDGPRNTACSKSSLTFANLPVYEVSTPVGLDGPSGTIYLAGDGVTRIAFVAPNDATAQRLLSSFTKLASPLSKQLVNLPKQQPLVYY